ncbi:helix-turn-helix domain-containing protein [Nocardia brasiliensis]|uniref:helix-turn-helix domain-containing protein n=1 Tax=Nocardia brasiliensis TaxID=37326 RepID=UPI003670159F
MPSSPPTQRVVEVVELLSRTPGSGLSLAEICKQLHISRATGHAILATLHTDEWVTRDERLRYRIGPALRALAAPDTAVERTFRPHLRELSRQLGVPVFLTEPQDRTLVVLLAASADPTRPALIAEGLVLPFVLPFGREFVAWEDSARLREWSAPAAGLEPALSHRIELALTQIRERGYGIERSTREYVRVFRAMHALAENSAHDEISARVAAAFAELTTIDFTADELAGAPQHAVATISAPIRDRAARVRMSVSAQPLGLMDTDRIHHVGAALCAFAEATADLVPATGSGRG